MDLLDFTAGTEVATATAIDWENVLNNINYFQDQVPSEAVFGFGNGLSATFDQFEVKIEKVHYYNPKNIELYAGDSPSGAFKKIATIQVENLYVKGLYQKFPFPPTTSKYFKIKVLQAQGGSFTFIPDMKLMGTLQ